MTIDDIDKYDIARALEEVSFINSSRSSLRDDDQTSHKVVSGVYYTNWSPYNELGHFPRDINFSNVTHIFYAFFHVDGNTGSLKSTDSWSDFQIPITPFEGHPNHPEGCLGELFILKLHQNFKVLMSVGGWSNRKEFTQAMQDEDKVQTLAKSCVETMFRYGFDGIDLDWEYPRNNEYEPRNFVHLVENIRFGLDALEANVFNTPKRRFEITIATPGTEDNLQGIRFNRLIPIVDYWNVMAYDYYGEWSNRTGYHSNLYNPAFQGTFSSSDTSEEDQEDDEEEEHSLSASGIISILCNKYKIPRNKVVMGVASYGRGFTNVETKLNSAAYVGKKYHGVGGSGPDKDGTWKYNELPLPGTEEEFDPMYGSAYCFDKATRTFIGYDNYQSIKMKGEYAWRSDLAGIFMWESAGDDYKYPNLSLLEIYANEVHYRLKKERSPFTEKPLIEFYIKRYPKNGFLTRYLKTILQSIG